MYFVQQKFYWRWNRWTKEKCGWFPHITILIWLKQTRYII